MRANGAKNEERGKSAPSGVEQKRRNITAEDVIRLCCESCFDVRDGVITPEVANAIANDAHAAARVAAKAERVNVALNQASSGAASLTPEERYKVWLESELRRLSGKQVHDDN